MRITYNVALMILAYSILAEIVLAWWNNYTLVEYIINTILCIIIMALFLKADDYYISFKDNKLKINKKA